MFLVLLAIITLLILGVIASTLYVVRQQTVVIIERFGKYQTTSGSGIHVRLPFGIDKNCCAKFNYVCCNLKLLWKQRLKTMFL